MISKKNIYIDFSRSISMLYIIGVLHLLNYSRAINIMPWGEYIKNATLGLFVFISGYLLAKKYNTWNKETVKKFITKRLLRIIPLFALSLLMYFVAGFNSLQTTLFSLTGLSMFWGIKPPTLWFVSMIIVFYFLFPLISGKKNGYQFIISFVIFVLVYAWSLYSPEVEKRFLYYWPCFSLGVILSRYNMNKLFKSYIFLFIELLLFIVTSIIFHNHIIVLPDVLYRILISISGLFVILSLSHFIPVNAVTQKMTNFISYSSMAAYLFHRQVYDVFEKYIFWPADGYGRVLFLFFLCLPIIIIIGYLIQKIYDFLLSKLIVKV